MRVDALGFFAARLTAECRRALGRFAARPSIAANALATVVAMAKAAKAEEKVVAQTVAEIVPAPADQRLLQVVNKSQALIPRVDPEPQQLPQLGPV